jgi:tetratricopeptide (TPR) repeat protein
LTAVNLNTASRPDISIKETARLFPPAEIAKYRTILDELTLQANKFALGPDTLTLKGLFLEQEGRKEKAKELYQEAILRSHLKYTPGSRHPMQIPLITPWNALGYLLKSHKNPDVQAKAKEYFEMGALQGGDPLSYYELSAFEPKTSTKWLHYTSKAAASGHRQAIINLADFYQGVAEKQSPILKDNKMRKTLNWLLGWRRGSAAALAREWLQVASNIGHKPSMLQLADYHYSLGEHELAKEYLRHMLEPVANQSEEWPQLVQIARKRLAGLR